MHRVVEVAGEFPDLRAAEFNSRVRHLGVERQAVDDPAVPAVDRLRTEGHLPRAYSIRLLQALDAATQTVRYRTIIGDAASNVETHHFRSTARTQVVHHPHLRARPQAAEIDQDVEAFGGGKLQRLVADGAREQPVIGTDLGQG